MHNDPIQPLAGTAREGGAPQDPGKIAGTQERDGTSIYAVPVRYTMDGTIFVRATSFAQASAAVLDEKRGIPVPEEGAHCVEDSMAVDPASADERAQRVDADLVRRDGRNGKETLTIPGLLEDEAVHPAVPHQHGTTHA